MLKKLVDILRKKGNNEYLEKAESLVRNDVLEGSLHLRNLDLVAKDIEVIAKALKEENDLGQYQINSISLSYNKEMGDNGTIFLMKNLPFSTA